MHNAWGSYPIFFRTLILWSLSSVCWWKASFFLFGTLCHHETLWRVWFVWNLPLFWELDIFFLLVCIIGYLIPWCIFIDIFRVMISPFGILFLLGISFQLVSVLESLKHAYLLYVISFACFLSLTQYIGETPPSLKLAKMCMKFNFISICTYSCGVCSMCCWFTNSVVIMSLGTILFVVLF